MHRRTFLNCSLFGLVSSSPILGSAMTSPPYAGRLRMSLPLGFAQLDPHDPEDLGAALLGPGLFEPLFQLSASGQPYPTLARLSPKVSAGRVVVHLRENLRFGSGEALTAEDAIASIARSQTLSSALLALKDPKPVRGDALAFSVAHTDPIAVAKLLSGPRSALVPRAFLPHKPDSAGALRVTSLGAELKLSRNPYAPRGGSYLDEVVIRTASVSECLRAFEATESDVGFLGAGLHQSRPEITNFRLAELGLAVLIASPSAGSLAQPGVLHETLRHLPAAPFDSLGAERARADTRPYRGAPVELVVSLEDPWLSALAHEVKRAWAKDSLLVKAVPRSTLRRLRASGEYELMLTAISHESSPETVSSDLFRLDSKAPPKSGRILPPAEIGRQLSLGLLGTLRPSGATANSVRNLVSASSFQLQDCFLTSRKR